MQLLTLCALCLALLAGCGAQTNTNDQEGPPVTVLEQVPLLSEPAASISLTGVPPYDPWVSLAPDTVSTDTMGDTLCETTLPDGTEAVCYWAPGGSDTKYWAIRQGDSLLRFCEETACYTEGYAAEPFSDVLGQDGFRITAPRGAAYLAYDYYVMDGGIPRLLAACANNVIEADVNGDGERELLWFYHGGRDIYYLFRREGVVREVCLTDTLAQQENPWLAFAASLNDLENDCLPVEAAQGGWETFTTETKLLPGRLRFTADAVYLEPDLKSEIEKAAG